MRRRREMRARAGRPHLRRDRRDRRHPLASRGHDRGRARSGAASALLDGYLAGARGRSSRWYYTPMMLPFSRHLDAGCTVYDCMDELANFRFAPPELLDARARTARRAPTSSSPAATASTRPRSDRHPNIHPFPSQRRPRPFRARRARPTPSPADQAALPRPRLGFYGVIDERIDLELLAAVADARPDWSIVMVGPVVKIDPADLPQRRQHPLSRRQEL